MTDAARTAPLPEVNVRRMRSGDVKGAAAVERACFSIPWKEQDFADMLNNPYAFYMCALCGGEVAGICGFLRSFETAEVLNVAVLPAFRRRGIARLLLGTLMEEGRAAGVSSFTLEVRAGNAAALALYEGLGFHRAGVRKNFYTLPTEDAVIMWTGEDSNI